MSILTEPHRRRTVATAVCASSALLLGGCSFWAPNTAVQPYAPSDGLQEELGDVMVRNVLVVSEGDGEAGVLSAGLVNRAQEDTTVVIEVGGTVEEVEIAAGASVLLGVSDTAAGEEGPLDQEVVTVVVDSVDPIAGDVIEVVVSEESAGSVTLQAPIYLPEGVYEELVPPTGG